MIDELAKGWKMEKILRGSSTLESTDKKETPKKATTKKTVANQTTPSKVANSSPKKGIFTTSTTTNRNNDAK
jgi:hypothetical protein